MIAVLVQVAVFFVIQVSVESCNDKYIKDMFLRICGMNTKRSFSDNSNRGSLFGLNLRGMLDDAEREFKRLVEDTVEADWQLQKSYEHKPKGIYHFITMCPTNSINVCTSSYSNLTIFFKSLTRENII